MYVNENEARQLDYTSMLVERCRVRIEEIHHLSNIMRLNDGEPQENIAQKNTKVKALIVLLYASFEGYVKEASEIYLEYIERQQLNISDVLPILASASLHKEFNDVETGKKKSDMFRYQLPDDSKLHRYYRREMLFSNYRSIQSKRVSFPEGYLSTESNLKYSVLQRILYLIGIDPSSMSSYEKAIGKLIGLRNPYAHGERSENREYIQDYEELSVEIENFLKDYEHMLVRAIINQHYLYHEN